MALIEKLRAGGANKSRIPNFLETSIKDIVTMVT